VQPTSLAAECTSSTRFGCASLAKIKNTTPDNYTYVLPVYYLCTKYLCTTCVLLVYYSVHKSCTLGFHGTRVSYQYNIRLYVCRNVPLVHFSTSMLLIPGHRIDFHRHVTPISRYQIFLTHPHRGTKFPNPHNFILVTFLVVAISILPPPHLSNRPNQSILP
jgi:hypothetical protein